MMSNKSKQLSVTAFVTALLTLMFFAPASAGEAHPDPARTQKTYLHQSKNLILEAIDEDSFFIGGEQYIFTNQTHLIHHNRQPHNNRLQSSDIITPCLVDIVYRQYTTTTENAPFAPGTKILEKITILKEITPESFKSGRTRPNKHGGDNHVNGR